MKTRLHIIVALAVLALASPVSAQCFADFKARHTATTELRLQYGIIELPASACGSLQAAWRYAEPVIARSGWTLRQIESIFDASEFQRRSANAGVIHRRQ